MPFGIAAAHDGIVYYGTGTLPAKPDDRVDVDGGQYKVPAPTFAVVANEDGTPPKEAFRYAKREDAEKDAATLNANEAGFSWHVGEIN